MHLGNSLIRVLLPSETQIKFLTLYSGANRSLGGSHRKWKWDQVEIYVLAEELFRWVLVGCGELRPDHDTYKASLHQSQLPTFRLYLCAPLSASHIPPIQTFSDTFDISTSSPTISVYSYRF